MRWDELGHQPCSLARALSVLGDRWTMIILRECFLGVRRFDEFEHRLGITRHVLSDRLKKLVEHGALEKHIYQEKPQRLEYRLTEKGLDLHPILMHLVHWGDKYMGDSSGPPLVHVHKKCGHTMHAISVCSECGEPINARDVRVQAGDAWRHLSGLLMPVRRESSKD